MIFRVMSEPNISHKLRGSRPVQHRTMSICLKVVYWARSPETVASSLSDMGRSLRIGRLIIAASAKFRRVPRGDPSRGFRAYEMLGPLRPRPKLQLIPSLRRIPDTLLPIW